VVSWFDISRSTRASPQAPTQIILIRFVKEPKPFSPVESDYSTDVFYQVNHFLSLQLPQIILKKSVELIPAETPQNLFDYQHGAMVAF
jgi:hypothetical protein